MVHLPARFAACTLLVLLLGAADLPVSRAETVAVEPPAVLVGAGDIADCTLTGDSATAALLDDIPGTVFTLGDNAYREGTLAQHTDCYGPTWGRHKARTFPSAGNHEYRTSGAAGYFGYFGAAAGDPDKGYYSYGLGAWHVVVLNSNCLAVACAAGSAQEQWLRADLAAHPTDCTVAYFHAPRFSSGKHQNNAAMQPFWQALYDYGADVVMSAHDHVYERFAPQTPTGTGDRTFGIRQFTVGTGGRYRDGFTTIQPNSEVRDNTAYGVLKLVLGSDSYEWQFVSQAGKTFTDSGTGTCHGAPGAVPPPPSSGSSVAVPADADAPVFQSSPAANYGSRTALEADRDPLAESYLRFTVDPEAAITRARLRLFVTNRSTNGPEVYRTDSSWSETGLTWETRPDRISGLLADQGAVSSGGYIEWDVTGVVTGAGTYSFAVIPDSSDGTDFSSREAASNRPELLLDLESDGSPPPPDTTPPQTTITSGPSGSDTSTSATFEFTADEPGSTFACSLDGGSFTLCTSPRTYSDLTLGDHHFEVRATDQAGNPDATPAARDWTVVSGPTAPLVFTPVADARVAKASPDANFGTTTALEADNYPVVRSYLKFTVTGTGGIPARARLRLYVTDGSTNGPEVYPTGTTWSEGTITWTNKPAPTGALLADVGAVSSKTYVDYDLGPLTGDGTYSFALVADAGNGTDFRSREASANRPELVVTPG